MSWAWQHRLTTLESASRMQVILRVEPLVLVPVTHCYPESMDAPARFCWIGVFEKFRVNTMACRRRIRSVVSTFRCLCGGLGAICRFTSFWRHGIRRKGLRPMGKMDGEDEARCKGRGKKREQEDVRMKSLSHDEANKRYINLTSLNTSDEAMVAVSWMLFWNEQRAKNAPSKVRPFHAKRGYPQLLKG